jgi:hypothetical protein
MKRYIHLEFFEAVTFTLLPVPASRRAAGGEMGRRAPEADGESAGGAGGVPLRPIHLRGESGGGTKGAG